MFNMKMMRAAAVAGVLAVPMASTAAAQRPIVIGGGLVNLVITEVIDDVTVTVQDINVAAGVALQVAANVCDVNANVLAEQLRNGGATCEGITDGIEQTVTITR